MKKITKESTIPWHSLTSKEALATLQSNFYGLTAEEAEMRLDLFGANILPKPKRAGIFRIYLNQFKNPLIYILLIAMGISVGIQQVSDAIFILCVLQINAIIGAVQEWKAENQAEALSKILINFVTVRRRKIKQRIVASQLVPGDIIILQSGDSVPADSRLLLSRELLVDESMLTGESLPIQKTADITVPEQTFLGDRTNIVFAGSIILNGRAEALVVNTGRQTKIGHIAFTLTRTQGAETPLLIKMKKFTKFVGFLTLILVLLISVVQILQGHDLREVFLVAVALAVSAIPEGLPVALTVTLSIARHRMGKHNVIVRTLSAVEGLGATTLIASDKTGTLTCNELTIKKVYTPNHGMFEVEGEGYEINGTVRRGGKPIKEFELEALQRLAITGILCNEATFEETETGSVHFGDTVEVSFLVLAAKLGLSREKLLSYSPEIFFVPFESSRKFSASYNKDGGVFRIHVKGAAEVVLPMCKESDKKKLSKISEQLARNGYRVLALATKQMSALYFRNKQHSAENAHSNFRDLELLGIVGIIDPVRSEAFEAVEVCKRAGVQVNMITGDHPATALTIARKLGIAHTDKDVITGAQLAKLFSGYSDADKGLSKKTVFSRVEPTQKLMIIEALQRLGHFIAVIGDGVNDAPALYKANIGIAMGKGGTDIARSAADIILVDDKFSSIVAGIFEGRVAYSNVRKVIYLLLSTGFAEIVLFFLSSMINVSIPLFATQLLWLNLVTEGIQHIALAFEKAEKGLLTTPPRSPQEPIFDRLMVEQILISGGFMGFTASIFFWGALKYGWSEFEARNSLLLLMVVFENLHLLNCRSEKESLFDIKFFSNPMLILSITLAHGIHLAAMYTPGLREILKIQPVNFSDWARVIIIGLGVLVVMEGYKRFILTYRFFPRSSMSSPNENDGGD